MTESSDDQVGYCRPPAHSRFQKGQSGNPGGKSRMAPGQRLKLHFGVALAEALDADEEVLRKVKPGKVIESIARELALQAAEGRSAAQKLVLSILEREAREGSAVRDEEAGRQPTMNFAEENCRELLGERYDAFKTRFDRMVEAGSVDGLLDLAEDFQSATEIPASGNS